MVSKAEKQRESKVILWLFPLEAATPKLLPQLGVFVLVNCDIHGKLLLGVLVQVAEDPQASLFNAHGYTTAGL